MQAVMFLPHILFADLFQVKAVRHEELRKIDEVRPFFLLISNSHLLFQPLIISHFGCLLRFLLTSASDTLGISLHFATGKESFF